MPAYGVVGCGKVAEPPFDKLGPCFREPGHDGRCRFRVPVEAVEYVEVSRGESPLATDPVVLKYRSYLRKSVRISFACVLVTVFCAGWSLWNVLSNLSGG